MTTFVTNYSATVTNYNATHMKRIKTVFVKISRSRLLKYTVVAVLGTVIVGFADDNSIWSHYRNRQKIAELRDEISKLRSKYGHDMKNLKALEKDPRAIKKIARERYFMKTDDEDIFVLSDDVRHSQQQSYETTE